MLKKMVKISCFKICTMYKKILQGNLKRNKIDKNNKDIVDSNGTE